MMTTRNMYRPYAPTVDTGGDSEDYSTKILKNQYQLQKKQLILLVRSFFPFKAYKSGGVRFGPPPKKRSKSARPTVKMKTGWKRHLPSSARWDKRSRKGNKKDLNLLV